MSDAIFISRVERGGSGPTVAVKDCIDIEGFPTTGGSGALVDSDIASCDADVVKHMLAKGAYIVGKANMHELAYGVSGINLRFGTPPNAHFPELIPGGSSSGSAAAVAAGLVEIGIGTDTGGSIRMPSACCGVFGLKPSFGKVSRKGCLPAISSLDCVGPLARSVGGIEVGMTLIDPSFCTAAPPDAVRLGRVEGVADARVEAALSADLARGVVEVVPRSLPGMEEAFRAGITIMAAECWSAFGPLADDPRLGDDVRARLIAARRVTDAECAAAESVRLTFVQAVNDALEGVDALVLPTLPEPPAALSDAGNAPALLRLTSLTRPFNLSGHPALSIPIPGGDRWPASMQLVGRRGEDARLCALAHIVVERR